MTILRRVARVLERDSSTAPMAVHGMLYLMDLGDYHIRRATINRYLKFYAPSEIALIYAVLSFGVYGALQSFFSQQKGAEAKIRDLILTRASATRDHCVLANVWREWTTRSASYAKCFADSSTDFARGFYTVGGNLCAFANLASMLVQVAASEAIAERSFTSLKQVSFCRFSLLPETAEKELILAFNSLDRDPTVLEQKQRSARLAKRNVEPLADDERSFTSVISTDDEMSNTAPPPPKRGLRVERRVESDPEEKLVSTLRERLSPRYGCRAIILWYWFVSFDSLVPAGFTLTSDAPSLPITFRHIVAHDKHHAEGVVKQISASWVDGYLESYDRTTGVIWISTIRSGVTEFEDAVRGSDPSRAYYKLDLYGAFIRFVQLRDRERIEWPTTEAAFSLSLNDVVEDVCDVSETTEDFPEGNGHKCVFDTEGDAYETAFGGPLSDIGLY